MSPGDATHHMPAQPCPVCGYEHDAATNVTDTIGAPEPGDLSICLNCSALSWFTDAGLELVTDAELLELEAREPLLIRARRLIQARGHLTP